MGPQPQRKRSLFIVIGVVILLLFGILTARQAIVFRVASTSPKLSKVTTFAPYVQINFNHTLDAKKVTVNKADFINGHEIDKKALRVKVSNLTSGKKYTIHVPQATDTGGKVLKDLSFTFTVAEGQWDKFSDKEKKVIMDEQAKKVPSLSDPILSYIPYSTLDYRIEPITRADGKITVHIQLLLAPNTPPADEPALIEKYKSGALGYISTRGLDPSKYTIEYEVIRQVLNGH